MTPEAKILRSICRYLDGLESLCYYMKLRGGPYSVRGLPDIVGVFNGHFFALEVKASKGEVTPLQAHTLRKIYEAGGAASVVRSVKDVEKIIWALDRLGSRGIICASRVTKGGPYHV